MLKKTFFNRTEVLPYAIQVLQKAGYKLVTLAECLNGKPYLSVGSPSTPDVCHFYPQRFIYVKDLIFPSFYLQDTWSC